MQQFPVANVLSGTLGILVEKDFDRFDAIRGKAKNSFSFVKTLEAFALQGFTNPSSIVRGDFVAMDMLIEAILKYASFAKYRLYSYPESLPQITYRLQQQWASSTGAAEAVPRSEITAAGDLLAILAPSLMPDAFRLRNIPEGRVIPVIALSHGFSKASLLWDCFLKLCLYPTYACDAIICTSHASRAAMLSLLERLERECREKFHMKDAVFQGSVHVVPLSVDTDIYCPGHKNKARRALGLPQDAFVALSLGRISPMKADLFPLLHVFERLIAANPKQELILVISGTKEQRYADILERYISEHSLTKRVRFLCNVSDADKVLLYSAADVFVAIADSVQESFGLAPVEAMSCGLPQIVSNWDGYRDTVVHGETGFLVPTYWTQCDTDLGQTDIIFSPETDHLAVGQSIATDLREFQWRLQMLIDNEELRNRMGRNARRRAEDNYSFEIMTSQYMDLIKVKIAEANDVIPRDPFLQTGFFSTFQGHASHIISDDTRLKAAFDIDEATVRRTGMLARAAQSSPLSVDELIVVAVLNVLRRNVDNSIAGTAKEGLEFTIEQMTSSLRKETGFSIDRITRTIMWLIKQGVVAVHDDYKYRAFLQA